MMSSNELSTTTKDAMEPSMVSTLFLCGGGAEPGGTRGGGPASLDEVASFETRSECWSEVFQRETKTLLAMEHGESNFKSTRATELMTWEDETAGLEAGGESAIDGSQDDTHSTTALAPLASGSFGGFLGGDSELKGKKLFSVVSTTSRVIGSVNGDSQPFGESTFQASTNRAMTCMPLE